MIEEALAAQSGYKVSINLPLRGKRRKVIDFALGNAREALTRHLLSQAGQARMLAGWLICSGWRSRRSGSRFTITVIFPERTWWGR